MENTKIKIWEINVFDSIKDISNLEIQKLTWTGKHPDLISSFTEILAMLYDNFLFQDYLIYYKKNIGNDKLFKLLLDLDNMITDYQEIGYDLELKINGIEDILNDSNWIAITKKAKEIVLLRESLVKEN